MKRTAKTTGQDVYRFPIQGEMTIYQAAALKPVLLEALGKKSELQVDLSDVSEIDAAGIQLLVMLKKAAQEEGRKVSLTCHSPAVLEAFDLISLSGYFGDPVVIQPATAASRGRSKGRDANES